MKKLWNCPIDAVYVRKVDCGRCTNYGNTFVSANQCTECCRSREVPVKVVRLGHVFSRVVFGREMKVKIVLTSRLRTVRED